MIPFVCFLRAGNPSDVTRYLECACYYGESGKNIHCRSKEHVSKFNSRSEKLRSESPFFKHLMNTHGRRCRGSATTSWRRKPRRR